MKRWNKKIACLLLAAGLCLHLAGCEALDTTLPDEEETAQSEEQDALAVDPQGAVDQIYATLGRRIGLVEPTAEQLQSVVGLDPDDYTSAYVRYVETDFGADDVYIVLPKDLFHYKPNNRWGESYQYLGEILYPELFHEE